MISSIEKAVVEYLKSTFKDYGVDITFKYNQELDILSEFRRSIRLRVENDSYFKNMLDPLGVEVKSVHNLGLYSRSPVTKDPNIANNQDIEVFNRDYSTQYGIELRQAFYGNFSMNFKVLFDSVEMSDVFELLYTYNLHNKTPGIQVSYKVKENIEPIEDIEYSLEFSELANLGNIGSTDLRSVDFSIGVKGLVFLPYSTRSELLETIVLSIHVYNKSQKMDTDNITDDTLAERKVIYYNPSQQLPPP